LRLGCKKDETMKNRNMNKKAEQLLGEHTVNGIIEILVIVILVGFVIAAVIFFWPSADDSHLKQAINQLNKVVVKVNSVYENGEEESLDIFPPQGWFLRTFPDYDFPEGECRRKNNCLCICKSMVCDDKKALKCEGFDYEVEVVGDIVGDNLGGGSYPVVGGIGEVVESEPTELEGIMELDAVEVLKVFKEGDIVKIGK